MRRRSVIRDRLNRSRRAPVVILDMSRLKGKVAHEATTVDGDGEAFHFAPKCKTPHADTVDAERDRAPDRSAIGALSGEPCLKKTDRVGVG